MNKPTRPRQRSVPKLALMLVGVVVLGAILVGMAVQLRATTWAATSEVAYESGGTSALLDLAPAEGDIAQTLATQTRIVLSDEVIGSVARRLEVPRPDLVGATTVEAVPESNVLTISVEAGEPAEALLLTQAVTNRYVAESRRSARQSFLAQASALEGPIELLKTQADMARSGAEANATQITLADLQQEQLRLQSAAEATQGPARLLSEPSEPTAPSSMSTATGLVLGAGVGLVLAIGIYFLLDWARRDEAPESPGT